jgi:hypothetical protein
MKRFVLFLSSTGLLLLMAINSNIVNAEPYLAIKAGTKCSSCHVNQTGGGKRTITGAVFGQTAASARPPISLWKGAPDNRLSLGTDLRANFSSTTIPNQTDQLAFELEEALLYAEIELLKDQVSIYLDQNVAPGAAFNREAFGLFKFADGDYYAKAGRFFLPYGFRLEDDTAFIRQATGFNFANPDTGVEFGMDRDKVTANLAISNGSAGTAETDMGKQLSFRTSFVERNWRIGGSFNFNDTESANRTTSGLFGGLRTGPVQWLGEFAFIRDALETAEDRDQFVLFTEANIGWRQGHNVKLTYEHLDPDQDIDENEQNRYSAVYEYFPIQFVQLIGGLRINEGIPQADNDNADEAFVQMHLYF